MADFFAQGAVVGELVTHHQKDAVNAARHQLAQQLKRPESLGRELEQAAAVDGDGDGSNCPSGSASQALSEEAALAEDVLNELKELISIKNHFGAEELLAKQNLRSDLFEALRDVPQLFGNAEILEKAKGLTRNPAAREALDRLATIYEIVKDYGYEKYVFFDLGLLSKFHYYTGIIFQAYTYGTGEPIVKGGRYDALLQHFGKKAPAIGFCTVMESLMNALERQKISLPIANTKTMLLYPDFLQPLAVKLANEHRSKGMDVALVCFARDKVLADYEEYGRKNQFGGIVYIQKSDSVLAIDLSTGEVQPVEL